MRYHFALPRMVVITNIVSGGRDVEKSESSYTANVKWYISLITSEFEHLTSNQMHIKIKLFHIHLLKGRKARKHK